MNMKVFIVGGGGREHAIAVSMKKSSRVEKLYCVPGNAGIAQIAECDPSIGVMEFDKVAAFAKTDELDITIVGLCTDICVVSNALLLKAYLPETPIRVIESCCAGSSLVAHQAALKTMEMCQIEVVP